MLLNGDGVNILGRNLISLYKDFTYTTFENFNIIIINEKHDLLEDLISYRNCVFHYITLKPIKEFIWNYKVSDTLNLNFINLKDTKQADLILKDILNFEKKEENFNFLDYKLFSNFIIENIPEKDIFQNKEGVFLLGSSLYMPTNLIIKNKSNNKIKLDLYPFSNNYNVVGLNIITSFNEFKLYLDNNITLLNKNIEIFPLNNIN